jgi:hypothetical protein
MSTSVTLADSAKTVEVRNGEIVVSMQSGVKIRFKASSNPRLAKGTPWQLEKFEVSPFGIHWPDLDEDLSFRGMLAGDFGQKDMV